MRRYIPIYVALAAALLVSGCGGGYGDSVGKVLSRASNAAKSVLENVDIQPTPETNPEDDMG